MGMQLGTLGSSNRNSRSSSRRGPKRTCTAQAMTPYGREPRKEILAMATQQQGQ